MDDNKRTAERERKSRYRAAQKEKARLTAEGKSRKNKIPVAAHALVAFKQPFFDFLDDHSSDFHLPLELAGIEPPVLSDDSGPEDHVKNGATDGVESPFGEAEGSLGRAVVIVECLIDAARELADIINKYQRREIAAQVAEIECADVANPQIRKAAQAEAARLNKMLDQLDKQVRWTFPQWKVTG